MASALARLRSGALASSSSVGSSSSQRAVLACSSSCGGGAFGGAPRRRQRNRQVVTLAANEVQAQPSTKYQYNARRPPPARKAGDPVLWGVGITKSHDGERLQFKDLDVTLERGSKARARE